MSESETLQSLKEKNYNIPLLGAYFAKCQLHYFKGNCVKAIENANEASTRQIVEEVHLGKLSCQSILGEGTQFTISLPCN